MEEEFDMFYASFYKDGEVVYQDAEVYQVNREDEDGMDILKGWSVLTTGGELLYLPAEEYGIIVKNL